MNKEIISAVMLDNRYKTSLSPDDLSIMMVDIPTVSKELVALLDKEIHYNTAMDFINWAANNGWYRNGKRNGWYQIPSGEDKSTAQMFVRFLHEYMPEPPPVKIHYRADEYYNQLTKYNRWSKNKSRF